MFRLIFQTIINAWFKDFSEYLQLQLVWDLTF